MIHALSIGELVEKGWLSYGDGNYSSKYPKTSELLDFGEIPFISAKNLRNGRISYENMRYISPSLHSQLKKGHVMQGDTLLVTRAGVGTAAYVSGEFDDANINAQLVYLRPDGTNIKPNYLYQLFSSPKMKSQLISHSSGSAQGQLPIRALLRIMVEIPDANEQDKIAEVLGTIDEKIELNRKMNFTLEQIGQALFRQYFIDNPAAKLWPTGTITDIGEVITGKTPSKSKDEYFGNDVPFLKVPDMHNQTIIIQTEDHLSNMGAASQSKKYIQKWSTAVSCIATVGVISLVGKQVQTNQQINSVIPVSENHTFYNFYTLISKKEMLKTMASAGSATPNLNKGHFEKIKVALPPEDVLDKFHNEIKSVFLVIENNMHESQSLTNLRDTLLPRLFSGKITL